MWQRLALAFASMLLLAGWPSPARALDIGPLLDTCPQHDPAYQQIRNDFQIRRDGVVVGDIPCTEPISAMALADYSEELIDVQSLRAVLYMDLGTGQLPWAPGMRLYDWMKAKVGGIDIRADATLSHCCEVLDGKTLFIQTLITDVTRMSDRQWIGISNTVGLFAHEMRHAEGNGFPHVSCCGIPNGCDQTYDESNLSPYGLQWWLNAHWLTGDLYNGFSCLAPQEVSDSANFLLTSANLQFSSRFCDTKPPVLTLPAAPGGVCRSPLGAIDLFIVVDLSGSFIDDLPVFQAEAPAVIAQLTSENPGMHVGLGSFQDYPIPPFGNASLGDKAYTRLVDLTADQSLVLSTIAGLSALPGAGADDPQSQLAALFQAATGAGQDLSSVGFPGASITAGQQANFRPGATKVVLLWTDAAFHQPGDPGNVPYPGPSFAATVAALQALDPARVIGISSGAGAVADLRAIATATGAVAPLGGVDCDGDGVVDVPPGAPLVCTISSSGTGVGPAVTGLVNGAVAAAAPVPLCQTVTVVAPAGQCSAAASVNAGSFDPEGGPVTLVQAPPGPYPVGQNPLTLTVHDTSGLSASCTASVTVTDVTKPRFTVVPPAVTITQCTAPNIGLAQATDACGVKVTSNAPAVFHVGQTVVTWMARDPSGNTATATQTVTVALGDDPSCCPAGTHVIVGTSNNDVLTGTAGADCILGKGGQDIISGLGGNDFISGGDGDDVINAGDGDDVVFGGSGQDVISGGNGNDTLHGGDGDDRVSGDAGNDVLFGEQGQDQLTGGPGTDQCIGGDGTNTFITCEIQQ